MVERNLCGPVTWVSYRLHLAFLGAALLLSACATTEELYARYDCDACAQEKLHLPLVSTVMIEAQADVAAMPWEPAVYFRFDRDELLEAERLRLEKNFAVMQRFPDALMLLRGFTDSFGTRPYNDDLSHRRVEAVRQFMIARGLAEHRLREAAMGETGFLQPGNSSAMERAINRRVEMLLVDQQNKPYRLLLEDLDEVRQGPMPGTEGRPRGR